MLRKTVLHMLERVLDGGYLNLVLKEELPSLDAGERAFAAALLTTTIEKLVAIDYIIQQYAIGKRVRPYIRNVLRLGVAQLKFMRVAQYAAVDECVKLAKEKDARAGGFVNAVLREMLRRDFSVMMPKDIWEQRAVEYACPVWLVKLLFHDLGEDAAKGFLRYHPADNDYIGYDENLNTVHLNGDIASSDEFLSGGLSVMGETSQLAVKSIYGGERTVLDVCAAPGGKSAYLYRLSGEETQIIACDIHEHRVKLMCESFERQKVKADTLVRDAATGDPIVSELVMVDAPCSALGLIHKKPDIKMNRKPEDIESLALLSAKILENSAQSVQKGGTLAYFTCTVTNAENGEVIDHFLKNHGDFSLAFQKTYLPPEYAEGFFVCKMKRKN